MKTHLYILKGKEPIPEPDAMEWTHWFHTAERHVADTLIGEVRISTVFLALDYSFSMKGPPILFETMILGGEDDGFQRRYCTWQEAEQGHQEIVLFVKQFSKAESQINELFKELEIESLLKELKK